MIKTYQPIILSCLVGTSFALQANDNVAPNNDNEVLPKLMVTAVRQDVLIQETTRSIEIIDAAQIDEIQPQSVPEAVSFIPNVVLSGGGRASSQTVNIRGLSGTQVLQTIDGIQQRFESGHRPTYLLDPALIREIQVVKGPTSSLWGSGAIGGVVAQQTIGPEDLIQDDERLGGFVKGAYNDNNEEYQGVFALAGKTNTFSWTVAGNFQDSDDIQLGNGTTLLGSSSKSGTFLAKTAFQLNDEQSLGFSYLYSDGEGQIPTNGSGPLDPVSNYLIKRGSLSENAAIDYRIDGSSPLLNARIQTYWNKTRINENRVADGRFDQTELDALGANLSNQSNWGDIKLLYGMDAYKEDFSSLRSGTTRPTPPRAKTQSWAAFAQAEIPLAFGFSTELGVRYDSFSTRAENLNERHKNNATSPSLALVWQATDWWRSTLRYDEAFGAPSAEELYTTGTHFCLFPGFCNEFRPNPELNPEEAENIEWLNRFSFEGLLGDDALTVTSSIFRNDVKNFIEQIVTNPTFHPVMDPGYTTWVNVDEARLTGFEVETSYSYGALGLGLSYGQTRGKNQRTNEYLFGIPANKWVGQVSYAFFNQTLKTGVRFVHADAQNEIPSGSQESYSSYSLLDLYATWKPEANWARQMQFDLAINNLTDKYYRVAFDQIYQPGREVIFSARYNF